MTSSLMNMEMEYIVYSYVDDNKKYYLRKIYLPKPYVAKDIVKKTGAFFINSTVLSSPCK